MKILGFFVLSGLFLFAFLAYLGGQGGFSDADMIKMKESIREEFEKQANFKVDEVVMVKESSRKATGFVKIRVGSYGPVNKSCSATMAEGGSNYFWRCD